MRKSLLMILFIMLGFTCVEAQNQTRKRLIQTYYSVEQEIDGRVFFDANKNGMIDDDEQFMPEDFKIVPEVNFAYDYVDENHSYLNLKFLGNTQEYRNVFLYEVTELGSEDLTYLIMNKEGELLFSLGYAEAKGKWSFIYIK